MTTGTELDPADDTELDPADDVTSLPSSDPQDTPPADPPAGNAGGEILQIRQSSLKGIKSRSRAEGQKIAIRELNRRAVALGYASIDDMFESQPAKETPPKAAPPPPVEPPPLSQTTPDPKGPRVSERDLRLARQVRQERAARIEAQAALENAQAEAELRLDAVRAGITDVDYAMTLLKRHIATIAHDEEALEELSVSAYFGGLKATAPYLFSTQTVPATTGPSGDDTPPPPRQTEQGGSVPVNVRDMSKADYAKYLTGKGLTDPTFGAPV